MTRPGLAVLCRDTEANLTFARRTVMREPHPEPVVGEVEG